MLGAGNCPRQGSISCFLSQKILENSSPLPWLSCVALWAQSGPEELSGFWVCAVQRWTLARGSWASCGGAASRAPRPSRVSTVHCHGNKKEEKLSVPRHLTKSDKWRLPAQHGYVWLLSLLLLVTSAQGSGLHSLQFISLCTLGFLCIPKSSLPLQTPVNYGNGG